MIPVRLLAFLTLVNILNFFDRYIVHAIEPVLKAEMALSNQQSGMLVSAFVVGYFIFSPIFGYLGDRYDRRYLMAIGLFAWSIATALTGLATGFVTFFAARILVGIGEASFGPIVPGYLKSRVSSTVTLNSALSIFYVAIPVGAALGYVVGGKLAHWWGWPRLFLIAAIPGLVLSAGFLFIAKEEKASGVTEMARIDKVKALLEIYRTPVLRLAILGYIFNTFALNGIAAFVVRYGRSLGMQESDASTWFGIILLVTGFFGTFGGGLLASQLARKAENSIKRLLQFVSISTFVGTPFLAYAFFAGTPTTFLIFCFLAELMLFAGVAPLNAVLVSRAPAGLETFTQGVTIFMINLFGSILAPIMIGQLADILVYFSIGLASERYLAWSLQLATLAMAASAWVWLTGSQREVDTEL